MSLKQLRPTTSTRRHTVILTRDDLVPGNRYKHLFKMLKYAAGRNNSGKITMRHKGGRVKRQYRIVDFMRSKRDVRAKVEAIEYDPNRSANLALLKYMDGERTYILAPDGLKVGAEVVAGINASVKVGNALPLKKIPAALFVHNVELNPGKGGVLGRAAGANIQIQGGAKGYVQLKMPSGEIRIVGGDCFATIGIVGNLDFKNIKIGKAGRKRRLGIKPTVRGVAQSGGKHPHGDGQGKSGRHGPGGPAKDPWGNRLGRKTRNNPRTNKYIIHRRPHAKGKKNSPYKTLI
ncbi:MAG TPA: 50S ribosomal protein L2 [Candidatus Dojkabacteria bacterium]|nr:50S ribosomal protein L2 [Candidatus Dojkabacteria bacterium]